MIFHFGSLGDLERLGLRRESERFGCLSNATRVNVYKHSCGRVIWSVSRTLAKELVNPNFDRGSSKLENNLNYIY